MRGLIVCLAFVALPASAQVFKCTVGGVTTYSEIPCGEKPKVVDLKVYQPTAAERIMAAERAETDREDARVVDLERRRYMNAARTVDSTNRLIRETRRQNNCDWFRQQEREMAFRRDTQVNAVQREQSERSRKTYADGASAACAGR